jgi:hypothetical protein
LIAAGSTATGVARLAIPASDEAHVAPLRDR